MSAGVPETDHVAFVVLAEVERGLAAGQRCVYPEDVQDATGLTWKQVQAVGADLARVGLVDVVDSAHFGVLRFIGLSDLAAGVVRAVQRAEHDCTTPQPRQRDLDRMWRCPGCGEQYECVMARSHTCLDGAGWSTDEARPHWCRVP